MGNLDNRLMQYLREQIALEEHLYSELENHISEVKGVEYADAKNLLIKTKEALASNFAPLNEILDGLEKDAISSLENSVGSNGNGVLKSPNSKAQVQRQISRILRDDYSALNLITMSNTLLHTTALALHCDEVAAMALKHLENLAPLVIKIGALVPEVVARELRFESPDTDPAVAHTALTNTQLIWRNLA